ncbi:MAG: sugar ABC transporter substrate-binding protein [Patescibacteria group bacterium]
MDIRSFTSSNRLLYILVVSIALLVFLTIVLILRGLGGNSTERITLEFWGVYDATDTYNNVIRNFESQHSNVKIIYRQFSFNDYERKLVDSLAAGSGPDITMIHNSWLPKHGDKLIPMPEDKLPGYNKALMTLKEFQEQFVDVAFEDLVSNNRIYAMPIYMDTLALYYNKDLLNAAAITEPPKTWDVFNDNVSRLTRFDESGNIIQSGAAIGSARNINRSTDILMSLMLQSGVQMVNDELTNATFTRSVSNINVGETALRYYTEFTNPNKQTYTWNNSQHYSIDAFVEGKTAMMFNYAHQVDIIRGKSPRLNFSVAPMPQLSSTDAVTYANYWAPAVTINSLHPNEAWEFIAYLASREGSLDYLTATKRPAARRDIIELQRDDSDVGVFAVQALTARSWYQADNTAIEGIFADMIDKVIFNEASPRDALQEAESEVDILMGRR